MSVREPEPSALIDRAPSHTAFRVAALRALHQTFDAPPVFEDPLAERILGPSAGMVLDRYRTTAAETVHLRATLAARGVVASQTIADGIAKRVRQCVILGAGLDTFAYRNTSSGLHVFEVDQPKTQAWKRDVLREAEIERLAQLILNLGELYGRADAGVIVIADMISHDEIAALVGSTRQWVTMMLKRFGRDEIVAYRGRDLWVLKADLLREVVAGDQD